MEEHGYKIVIFMSSISVIGSATPFYSETYNGSTLILPLTEGNTRIPLTLNSSLAKQWCSRIDATLPRITYESDQRNIVQFIRNATRKYQTVGIENVFVNSINHTLYDNWTWVNGQPNQGFTVKQVGQDKGADRYFAGSLWTGDYHISESRPLEPRRYICETSTPTRNSSHCGMQSGNRCYWKKNVLLTWLKARQACFKEGADLASFEQLNERNLKVVLKDLGLIESSSYWVGIHKAVWQWNDKATVLDAEIKYSNWKANHPSNFSAKCLCLNKQPNNDYDWIDCECDKSYPFICKRNGTLTSSTALYRPTSKVSTVNITTRSTVGITTRPTVGITTRSTVGIATRSTVGIVTRSTVDITAKSTVGITTMSTVDITTISTVDIKTMSTISPKPINDVTQTSAILGSVVQILLLISCCVIIVVLVILIVVAYIIRKERNRLVKSSLEVPSAANTTEVATNESAIYDEIEEIKETKANKSSTNCTASRAMYTAVRSAPKARKEKPPKDIVYAELDVLSTA